MGGGRRKVEGGGASDVVGYLRLLSQAAKLFSFRFSVFSFQFSAEWVIQSAYLTLLGLYVCVCISMHLPSMI